MGTIKEEALAYTPKQTKNISELPELSTDLVLEDGEGIDKEGKAFKYKYLSMNGEEYRVPYVVIGQLKDQLEANPTLKKFKVKKTGDGMATRYTIIPLAS